MKSTPERERKALFFSVEIETECVSAELKRTIGIETKLTSITQSRAGKLGKTEPNY
jgi:hypothetical protein